MSLVPLSERSGVDLDNGGFCEGVCADKLVVRGMVRDNDHADLAGDALGSPREVTGFEAESTELLVTTTGTDDVNALGSDTGNGGLATLLESSVKNRP